MNLKEEFLKIKNYDEYREKKSMFEELDFMDAEVCRHYRELLILSGIPKSNSFYVEGVHIDRVQVSRNK